jgi:hypothetical protein
MTSSAIRQVMLRSCRSRIALNPAPDAQAIYALAMAVKNLRFCSLVLQLLMQQPLQKGYAKAF